MSLFAPAPAPSSPFAPVAAPEGRSEAAPIAEAPVGARAVDGSGTGWPDPPPPPTDRESHLLVRVGSIDVAFPVSEVREVLRSAQVRLLGSGSLTLRGRPVAHVDVRGRTVPVVDLRSDPTGPGDVLLPYWRRQAGVVVDRVVTVLGAEDLLIEPGAAVEALPAYAHGVGRTAVGDLPVLLVTLPDLSEAEPAEPTGGR